MFGTDWPLANYGDYIEVVKWLIPEEEWGRSFMKMRKESTDYKKMDCLIRAVRFLYRHDLFFIKQQNQLISAPTNRMQIET